MAFFRDHMDRNRTGGNFADLLKMFDQGRQIVSVDRSDVFEPHLFEEDTGDQQVFCQLLDSPDQMDEMRSERQLPQDILHMRFQAVVASSGNEAGQMRGYGPDAFGNGHLVVVDDQDEVAVEFPDIVQGLEGDTVSERAVSHDGNDLCVASDPFICGGKTHGRGEGGSGVSRHKSVVLRLRGLLESREPPVLPDRMKIPVPPRQHLMRIRLMPHIPDDRIRRAVEHSVQRHGQLDHAEVRSQVSSVF